MKCPKCSYIGFETGDRCRNCGYDFSLLPDADIALPEPAYDLNADLILRETGSDSSPPAWHDAFDSAAKEPLVTADVPVMTLAAEASFSEPSIEKPRLPLFARHAPDDDEPLVKLPAAPRQPLAVRRTPELPRLRSMLKDIPRMKPTPDPIFQFGEEPVPAAKAPLERRRDRPAMSALPQRAHDERVEETKGLASGLPPSGVGRRLAAAMVDHGILCGIDLVVVYFTLRMTSLTLADWWILPVAPMLAFLGMVKLAYFSAFTSFGGQTIGKMAANIRVIADDAGGLDAPRAMQRAVAVLVSLATLGIGFLPALGPDRRAFHDRLARTRVVALPSA